MANKIKYRNITVYYRKIKIELGYEPGDRYYWERYKGDTDYKQWFMLIDAYRGNNEENILKGMCNTTINYG
jgi:hypothetical protein